MPRVNQNRVETIQENTERTSQVKQTGTQKARRPRDGVVLCAVLISSHILTFQHDVSCRQVAISVSAVSLQSLYSLCTVSLLSLCSLFTVSLLSIYLQKKPSSKPGTYFMAVGKLVWNKTSLIHDRLITPRPTD